MLNAVLRDRRRPLEDPGIFLCRSVWPAYPQGLVRIREGIIKR